jgi:hypothetical protein
MSNGEKKKNEFCQKECEAERSTTKGKTHKKTKYRVSGRIFFEKI